MSTLGENVRTLRKFKRMTQATLAKNIGRKRDWLARVETGAQQRIFADDLFALARALDVTAESLMGDENGKRKRR